METLKFNLDINAPASTVWNVLWSDATYPQWTAVFAEGSCAESDWKEGSKILFTDGKGSGMFSKIKTLDENKTMVFEHLGEVQNGVEKNMDWQGATESYFLKENDGKTTLDVELAAPGEHKDYFEKTFPQALDKVKEIAEAA